MMNEAALAAIQNEIDRKGSITPKMIAEALNVDEKSIRRFLRSIINRNDAKGSKWIIDASAFEAIAKRFASKSHRNVRIITIDDLS